MEETDRSAKARQVFDKLPESTKAKIRETAAAHRSTAWRNSIAARKGKPLSAEHKAKLSESHRRTRREKPAPRKVALWPIAEDALLGLPGEASAKKRGGRQPDIHRQREGMGLAGAWPAAWRHGEALGWNHFGDFCSDFGRTKKEWAPLIKLSYRSFANRVKEKAGRPFSRSRYDEPHSGIELNAKWNELIAKHCYTKGKRWVERDFLASELRDLPAKHASLNVGFSVLGEALQREGGRKRPTVPVDRTPAAVMEQICREAIADDRMKPLVRFGLVLRDLLTEKPQLMSAGTFRSENLTNELLARDYGTTPSRIEDAVQGKLAALDPRTLAKLPVPLPRKNPGPKPGARSETKPFKVAADVNQQIPALTAVIQRLESIRNKAAARKVLTAAGVDSRQIAAVVEPTVTADPSVAARRFVSTKDGTLYDTVAKYHREFPRAGLN
jgi:hypothetical protein